MSINSCKWNDLNAASFHLTVNTQFSKAIKLLVNSSNAAFCFLDTYLIKVQMNDASDPIIHDAVMNYVLNKVMDGSLNKLISLKKHFMKIRASYIGCVDENNNYRTDIIKNTDIVFWKPCIVVDRVQNCVTLHQLLNSTLSAEFSIDWHIKLREFTCALLQVGNETGFAHHDMHSGNILFDLTAHHFVLIDYGRVYISDDSCISIISSHEKTKFQSLPWTSIKDYNNTNSCGFLIPRKEDEKDILGMYILNDLANMTHAVLSTPSQKSVLSELNKLVDVLSEVIDLILSNQEQEVQLHGQTLVNIIHGDDDLQLKLPLSLTLVIGYVWYIILHKLHSKHKDAQNLPLALYMAHCFVVYPQTFEILKPHLVTLYKFVMTPLINEWCSIVFHTSSLQTQTGAAPLQKTKKMTCWLHDKMSIDRQVREAESEFLKNIQGPTIPSDESRISQNVVLHKPIDIVAPAAGGNSTRHVSLKYYKLNSERQTKRQYVLNKQKKWYLDENRGRYRYSQDRLSIRIL